MNSQISRVGLTQKFDESTLIVEAEVLDKETFICNNGYVYERSTLKIYQTIKGISETRVHLITFGGKHGDTFQTWSHAAQVSKGQKFIAFLVPFDNACGEFNDFEFFSGSQGKYSYQGNDALLSITCPSENYKSPQEFYDRITELSGHSFSPVSINCRAADGQNCLEFLFEVSTPNPSDPLLSEVVVYIRSSNGPKLISKPVFGVKYNPDLLGENVVDSGVITLEDIGISNHYNYNSILENIAPDEVRISVDASNLAAPQLVQITDVLQN